MYDQSYAYVFTLHRSAQGGPRRGDTFRHYMNRMNRRIYKSAFRHRGKRLRVIPFLEKSEEGRWHYHVAIEPPTFMEASDFGDVAMEVWLQTLHGYAHGEVAIDANAGWIAYMAKRRGKSGSKPILTA